MEIPKRILRSWKLKREHGDGKAINRDYGLSEMTVSRVFKTGKCDDETFNAIAEYY